MAGRAVKRHAPLDHPSSLVDARLFRDRFREALGQAPEPLFSEEAAARCDLSEEIDFGNQYLSANVLREGSGSGGDPAKAVDAVATASAAGSTALTKTDGEVSVLVKLAERVASSKLATLRFLIDNSEAERSIRGEPNYLGGSVLLRESNDAAEPLADDEVILSVSLYQSLRPDQRAQEYRVLGSQPLSALRDVLYCLSDKSTTTTAAAAAAPNNAAAAGFFLIEGVCYDDTRASGVRLSAPIIEWAQRNPSMVPEYLRDVRAATMQDTRFIDLKLRLQCPYLYVHQGNCEHVIMFTELRLPHAADESNASAYPVQTFQSRIHRRKCRVCMIYPARYITYGDRLTSSSPFFFCDNCYIALHYDANGELLYDDYKVFDYMHDQ